MEGVINVKENMEAKARARAQIALEFLHDMLRSGSKESTEVMVARAFALADAWVAEVSN